MNKTISSLILLALFITNCTAYSELVKSDIQTGKMIKKIKVYNNTREYIVYIPKNYSNTTAHPLVFSFHGLRSTMEFNYKYTKFSELSEKENFIVVHPNGISKKWTARPNDDTDTDFIAALLDQLKKDYNIDSQRVYFTGMSMGGFFSFSLACKFSDQVAAIASVTGSMFRLSMSSCKPTRPIPVLQIHGTKDKIVRYSGIDPLLNFWINHNKTTKTPTKSSLPDIDPKDGSTVERFVYSNGANDSEVQHLKIIGGGHTWPGYKGNMDIDATKEVWDFFKKYDLNGKIK